MEDETHVDVLLLTLSILRFGYDDNAPSEVPSESDLGGRGLVLGGDLADDWVCADGRVACERKTP